MDTVKKMGRQYRIKLFLKTTSFPSSTKEAISFQSGTDLVLSLRITDTGRWFAESTLAGSFIKSKPITQNTPFLFELTQTLVADKVFNPKYTFLLYFSL